MHAEVGDKVVIHGRTVGTADRGGTVVVFGFTVPVRTPKNRPSPSKLIGEPNVMSALHHSLIPPFQNVFPRT